MIRKGLVNISVVAVVLLATNVYALGKHSSEVTVPHDASINGVSIPAGLYRVSWESHRAQVTITFKTVKESKVVATFPAKILKRNALFLDDAIVYKVSADGSRILAEIQFAGKKEVIVFDETAETSRGSGTKDPSGLQCVLFRVPMGSRTSGIQFLGRPGVERTKRQSVMLDQALPSQYFPFQFRPPAVPTPEPRASRRCNQF